MPTVSFLAVGGPVSAVSGYKRTDGEKLLDKKRTPVGNLLKKLKDDGFITQLSPFSSRSVATSYWLTSTGRTKVEELQAREVAEKIRLNEEGNS